MKIGIYPMVADVLHAGHVLALEEAKNNCDKLVVCLHCNPNYKSPVQTVYERYIQLRGVKFVDEIIPYNNNTDLKDLLESFNYDVYFLGDDYRDRHFDYKEVILSRNKDIYYVSRQHSYSSTSIKQRIKDFTDDDN